MRERLVVDDVVYEIDRGPEGTKYRMTVGAPRLVEYTNLRDHEVHTGVVSKPAFTPRVVGG